MLELLVVITILTGLLALAVPRVAASRERVAPHGAADRFVQAHGFARAAATRYGRVAQFRIEPADGRFYVRVTTPGGTVDTLSMVDGLPGNVAMISNRAVVCFDGRGLPTTVGVCQPPDLTAVFSSGEVVDTVRTTALGLVVR